MVLPAVPIPTRSLLWQRVGFRFAPVYGLLTITTGLFLPWLLPWRAAAEWFALTVLHQPLPPHLAVNGSGDTLENYVLAALYLLTALLVTLVWSLLERRGRLTERLFWPAHTALRFYTGFFLLFYGWSKLLLSQMPAPDLTDLLTPLGEMSPMGLLWRAVGASPLYEVAGGLAEAVAGALLLFRRTSLPGALLGAGVMVYGFLLNLSYDVPVKLFSAHLLLFCLLLLIPFLLRLWALLALAALAYPPFSVRQMQRQYAARPAASDLAGIYTVLNDSRPAASRLEYDTRWQKVALSDRVYSQSGQSFSGVRIRRVSGDELRGAYVAGPAADRLTVTLRGNSTTFRYDHDPSGHLLLHGEEGGTPFTLELAPDPDARRLTTRGFHWVNETPFNR
ncbi:hypothetical protein E5F05_14360 [Deinococcus metallilatus]|uniref:DoxX family protein n=1 Tax=Deinococcus metallilatus TaxID=1211322 RepID=A0AAJ5F3B3_9DEIO|nr:hypothetical protein [Deinococcus metallilatus]MBB5294252.1 hypothetical protein [Deinococcus metallilatus]QBY09028.1 hypothetical protein E5F05_14360 [Deinococcus metallilatus]RXJ10172.1 hypothetical protein ERJ73_13190 [Deinococcus metallilatus]TLK27891.1 hypothetical protein FCS05_08190 [Deinococcus metallilatus]GMA16411.1 hypothetical protein GCM10025871_27420 [Deinococcus metallilatus]